MEADCWRSHSHAGSRDGVTGFFPHSFPLSNQLFLKQLYFLLFAKHSLPSGRASSQMLPTRAMISRLQPYYRIIFLLRMPRPSTELTVCLSFHASHRLHDLNFVELNLPCIHYFYKYLRFPFRVLNATIKTDKPAFMTLQFLLERQTLAGRFVAI